MNTATNKINRTQLFKNNRKGEIVITGSGKFFREQKEHYSKYDRPCEKLYEDQVQEIFKNSSEKIRSLLSSI